MTLLGQYVDLDHHGDAEVREPGLLDLAVNVRMSAPPDWLRAALFAELDRLGTYPDPEAARAVVAVRHGRPIDEVLLTNGAAEAFTLIARTTQAQRAACVHPSFTEPEAALRDAGHAVERIVLAPPFDLDPSLVPDEADLVVLGNPTNPTGRLHGVGVLEDLARPGRTLVVDEAFADAVPGEPATVGHRRDVPGLVVVRSLTKTWGLAGLRVGYVLADAATIEDLARAQPAWPVNALALRALELCCAPDAVAAADGRARLTFEARDRLAVRLRERGIEVVDGAAPFLLIRVAHALAVRERLRAGGIAVRRCDTFPGLGGDWLRLAVVGEEHHDRIVEALVAATAGRSVPVPARTSPARSGRVVLVGAGPGHADLITMRGWRALHGADVVVADRLAGRDLVAELRPGVELVDAGKAPGRHTMQQRDINALVVKRARAGQLVIRLKGGDPFVFGRGAEEAEACAIAGIPVEVVPGLSSATGAPTLAGIPLTHRGLVQSFTVVSGHLPPDHRDSPFRRPGLANDVETLVLLMAVRNLTAIAQALLAAGRDAGTAVACVMNAGLEGQTVVRSTLGAVAAGEGPWIESPAVIVVGAVAAAVELTPGRERSPRAR